MDTTLHLTLKKKWFDMIASGVKREEYREMKPYWNKRLMCAKKPYDKILFRNGYSRNAPSMLIEFTRLESGLGIVEWGAPEAQEVFILKLGAILSPTPNSAGGRRPVSPVDVNVSQQRCEYCDGTGDVTALDGEYRGPCNCGAPSQFQAEIAAAEEAYRKPPCLECGAMTVDEAETKCRCGGDKDSCHGTTLWPD